MSYIDTCEDELDYGEEELGERDATPSSFQAGVSVPALADDEMVLEEDYEDLYEDVNIGYFQSPAEPQKQGVTDAGSAFGLEHDEEAKARPQGKGPGIYAAEQRGKADAAALQEPSRVVISDGQIKQEEVKGSKEKAKDTMELTPSPWSREVNYGHEEQSKEGTFPSANAQEKGVKISQMERSMLSPTPKEQGEGYSNGQGQTTSLQQFNKAFPPDMESGATGAVAPPGNGEVASGIAQMASGTNFDNAGYADRGFPVGSGKVLGSMNTVGRGGVGNDMSLEGGCAKAAGPPWTSQAGTQRDSSPNLANDHGPKYTGQQAYSSEGGGTMLFVGDLHWWTTDAELEAALSEYGRVKNLKFYEERVSGKSKGYCQVEFYDHAAAAACKQGMNGRKFHDRPCVVAFGNIRSIQDMGYAQEKRAHTQIQVQQSQMPSKRATNDTGGARGVFSQPEREGGGRSYGRMGTGSRTGYGLSTVSKQGQAGSARGRSNYMGKSGGVGVPYSQGHSGPMGGHQSGMMMHQGVMGQGYNPGYGPPIGRGGAAYSGYVMPVPPFSGMVQSFPSLGPGGLPGVAPHVNPAFFGRSANVNGMGMMPGGGLDGPHQGMWGDMTLSGWVGEEHDRRTRDDYYGEDGGGMDYGHSTDLGHEKGRTSGEWMERRRRDDRDADWERERYSERERDEYKDQRDREREREKNDDWESNRQVRIRNKARMVEEEEEEIQKLKLREEDYGKRRRMDRG